MNTKNIFAVFFAATALVAFTASCNAQNKESDGMPAMAGKAAPDFSLDDVAGKTVKLSDFKGKVVLLDFWATWCPPCRKEIPDLIELQKTYGEKGFTMLGVSLDQGGMAKVKPFVAKNGMNYPVVVGDAKLSEAYGGIDAIPTTFLIGKDGKILKSWVGFTEKAVFEEAIKDALK